MQLLYTPNAFYKDTVVQDCVNCVNSFLKCDEIVLRIFLPVANQFLDDVSPVNYISPELFLRAYHANKKTLTVYLNDSSSSDNVMLSRRSLDTIEVFTTWVPVATTQSRHYSRQIFVILCLIHEIGHHLTELLNTLANNKNCRYFATRKTTPTKVGPYRHRGEPAIGECGLAVEVSVCGALVVWDKRAGALKFVRCVDSSQFVDDENNYEVRYITEVNASMFMTSVAEFLLTGKYDEIFKYVEFTNQPEFCVDDPVHKPASDLSEVRAKLTRKFEKVSTVEASAYSGDVSDLIVKLRRNVID